LIPVSQALALLFRRTIPADEGADHDGDEKHDFEDEGELLHARSFFYLFFLLAPRESTTRTSAFPWESSVFGVFLHTAGAAAGSDAPITVSAPVRLSYAPMGLLRVKGTIDSGQFWPKGTSDADTAVIVVAVDAFQFQAASGGPFKTTHAFEGALVHGRQGAKAPIDGKGRVRVRLQGIDALELHYQPSPLGKCNLRPESTVFVEDPNSQLKKDNKIVHNWF